MGILGKDEHNTYVVNKKTTGAAVVEGLFSAAKKSDAAAEAEAQVKAAQAQADAQARMHERALDAEVQKEGLAAISAITFEGDAPAIVNALANLVTMFSAAKEAEKRSAKAIRNAALEKVEIGIRMLSSKGDAANTAYFEKKYKELKKQAFLAKHKSTIILVILIAGVMLFALVTGQF
jgi:hypothetical protein